MAEAAYLIERNPSRVGSFGTVKSFMGKSMKREIG
jgi:hypothetical protein